MEPITIADFDVIEIDAAVVNAERPDCHSIANALLNHAVHLQTQGRERAARAISLLGDVCSMALDPENVTLPFKPRWTTKERPPKRSFALEDLDDSQLTILGDLLSLDLHREIRARIADVRWVRCGEFRMVWVAVYAYLEDLPIEPDIFYLMELGRIQRALTLLRSVNHRKALECATALLSSYLIELLPRDQSYLGAELIYSLIKNSEKSSEPRHAELVDAAVAAATGAEGRGDWERARFLWEAIAQLWRLQGNTEKGLGAAQKAAETFVSQAEECVGQHMGYWRASRFLMDAIMAFRVVPRSDGRIKELHGRLLKYQVESTKDFRPTSTTFDVSAVVEQIRQNIAGRNAEEAIAALAGMVEVPAKGSLRQSVIEGGEKFMLLSGIPAIGSASDGRVVATREGLEISEAEREEAVLTDHMRERATLIHRHCGSLVVDTARLFVVSEHEISLASFEKMVERSVFKMDGRDTIVARGLFEGMRGDFLVATHLLVPQVEEWIRRLLGQAGVITSGISNEGIQQQHNLGTVLAAPELKAILGDDLVFNLEALLANPIGSNLRNTVAHGLVDADQFDSAETRYFWALILKLVALGTGINGA